MEKRDTTENTGCIILSVWLFVGFESNLLELFTLLFTGRGIMLHVSLCFCLSREGRVMIMSGYGFKSKAK